MSENLITLSRNEANVLQNFVSQVDYWLSVYGDKAKHLEILYFPEDDGFDVINGEENNGILKRNRITAFRADLLSWGTQQVKALKGWNSEFTVTGFACVYKDNRFSITCQLQDSNPTV